MNGLWFVFRRHSQVWTENWSQNSLQTFVCQLSVVLYTSADCLIGCLFLAVLNHDIPHIFAMTLFEEYIYWTDWETKSINRAHKSLGTNKSTLISTLHRPMDIHIYHPYRQPEGENTQCLDIQRETDVCSVSLSS